MDLKLSNQECIREPTVAARGGKNEFCQGVYFQMFVVVAQMCSNHSTEVEGFLAVKSWWNTLLTQMRACSKRKEGRFFYIDTSVSDTIVRV